MKPSALAQSSPSSRPFFSLRLLPILPLLLLLFALALPLLPPSRRRTFSLTHIRPLTLPSCTLLLVSSTPPPAPYPTRSVCCVVLLPFAAPPALAPSLPARHCHHLRLPRPAPRSPAAHLAAALPLLSARFHFSWLALLPNSTLLCPSSLASHLADLDPTALIRAGIPRGHPPPSPLPDLLADLPPLRFSDHLALLSSGLVAALARARVPAPPSALTPTTSYNRLLDVWLPAAAIPVRPLVLPFSRFPDLPTPAKKANHSCPLSPDHPVLVSVPATRQTACLSSPTAAPTCPHVLPVPASLRDVSFLVLPQGPRDDPASHPEDVYRTIRSAFPLNELIFADISSDSRVSRALRPYARRDSALTVKKFYPVVDAHVRNHLVQAASNRFVCFITDVQRLSWEARLGLMLRHVANGEADIAGGYLVRAPENAYEGRLGPELLATETTVGYRYGFTDEMTLHREVVSLNQLDGRDCFRAHRTSDFLLAERETLIRHQWRAQFGSLAHDEFFVRVMRKELKVAICDSGVRHRYRSPPTQKDRQRTDWFLLVAEAKRLCQAWDEELGDIGGLTMRGLEFDCAKQRICERTEIKGGNGTVFEKEWTCQSWDD